MSAADLVGGVVVYLKTPAVLHTLLAGRVFGGELPPAETALMPRKALVVKSSGGVSLTGGSFVEADTGRVDLFAFGETPIEAARVMREAALAMRRLRRSIHAGVLIHWANPAGGAIPGREPQTEWPREFQSFQVFHGLMSIEE